MPKREDIQSILVLGSGPIVIGQAAEFDYSGTQAVKALKRQGYRVILVNSNPATVMTDPEIADATYIEPLTVEMATAIIEKEHPDAILPTVGGQTGLNLALALSEAGVLERCHVQLIGATLDSIKIAEDRDLFRQAMIAAGLPVPQGGPAHSLAEAEAIAAKAGYPLLVRASFALGGSGAAWVYEPGELAEAVRKAIGESPIRQAWVEESALGWKEFELEVMHDRVGNFVIVCSIENLDPMGVHTGDSITVAPAQTLTDREYQELRDMARRVMQAVGVQTGGANVQFAVHPQTGKALVIEMNPRVSRSSALASKATGFPIAKIAALVAVGCTLDEIPNDITGETCAAFEPALDYVVVKIPRWSFDKFPDVDPALGPQMKSVGEVMALGSTFQQALCKAVQSLEIGIDALDGSGPKREAPPFQMQDIEQLSTPNADRLFQVYRALRAGTDIEEVSRRTGIDPWFLEQMREIAGLEERLRSLADPSLDPDILGLLKKAKQTGFSDAHLKRILARTGMSLKARDVRKFRKEFGILPTFKRVDTCAAEFEAQTPYLYSTYDLEDEARPTANKKVLILGGGPNRIGQGIEFDYCCCQASYALQSLGYEIIMLNCNPETVSTDYDTSSRLYFEPMTLEHVLNVIDAEQPEGVIIQLGGQSPLNLAKDLAQAGVNIWGTAPADIDLAEDRQLFAALLDELDIARPDYGIAHNLEEGRRAAEVIGYPVLVRPSFVLGGRAMAIVGDPSQLDGFLAQALEAAPGQPVLIDRFMEDAFEVDVDALGDGERIVPVAIMQHIEEAGVHSGDSACVLPPYKISQYHLQIMREYTERLGMALHVKGLLNVQYAIKDDIVYVLEANPRASRTVPFASKATGEPMARLAAKILAGFTLEQLGLTQEPRIDGFFVKEAVLPFKKLPNSPVALGPEMRSTGEVMGHASHFGHAFAKAEQAAGMQLPQSGTVLISVNDFDKGAALKFARDMHRMGFKLLATQGSAELIARTGLPVESVKKVSEGSPNIIDLLRAGQIDLILNTPLGPTSHSDGALIRNAAVLLNVPLLTTLSAAAAAVAGIQALRHKGLTCRSLQEHHKLKNI